MKKKLLSFLLAVMLPISLLPVTALAEGTPIDTWEKLQEAINNAVDYTETVIELTDNITAGPQNDPISIPYKKIIVLDLNGYTLSRDLTESTKKNAGHVIEVAGKLTVQDKTDTAKNGSGAGKITGGKATTSGGGGICLTERNCTLVLKSGSICNNWGSGVYLSSGQVGHGTFLMLGGSITGNKSPDVGGGISNYGGEVIIVDGKITGNEAGHFDEWNEYYYGCGGGISNHGGSLTVIGGEISGNYAGEAGGGIFTNSSLTLGGSPVISGNTSGGDEEKIGASSSGIVLQSGCPPIRLGDDTDAITYQNIAGETCKVPALLTENIGVSVVCEYDDGMRPLDGTEDIRFLAASDAEDVKHFVSENSNYVVRVEDGATVLAPKPIFNLCNGISLRDTDFPTSAEYGDFTLVGWYTARTGGDKITEITNDCRGKTFYAHWKDAETGRLALCDSLSIEGGSLKVGLGEDKTPISDLRDLGAGFGTDFAKAYGISYQSSTLTLDKAIIMPFFPYSSYKPCGIESDQALQIKLIGANRIGNPVSIDPDDDYEKIWRSYNQFGTIYGIKCSVNDEEAWEDVYYDVSFAGDADSSLTVYDQAAGIVAKNVTFGEDFEGEVQVDDLGYSPACCIEAHGKAELLGGTFELTSYMSNAISAASGLHIGGDADVRIITNGNGLELSDKNSALLIDGEAKVNIVSRRYGICLYKDGDSFSVKDKAQVQIETLDENCGTAVYANEWFTAAVSFLGGVVSMKVPENCQVISTGAGNLFIGETAVITNGMRTDNVQEYEWSHPIDIVSPVNAAQPVVIAFREPVTVTMGDVKRTVPYGSKVEKYVPTKSGYTFGGWYKNADCTQAWNFETDVAVYDITLCAKWIKNADPSASISGKVTYEGGAVVPGAAVELFLGSKKVAATASDDSGNYSFDNVEKGIYDIVVTKEETTKTELVSVTAGSFSINVVLPTKSISSKVEYVGEVPAYAKVDVSRAVVGGLNIIASETNVAAGEKVTIKLTVEPKADTNTTEQKSIKKEAGEGKKVEFLDLSLLMQTNDAPPVDIGDENTQLLTIVIPFDFKNVDVTSVMILRNHGGKTTKLAASPNEFGEYIEINEAAGTITLHAMKFSDYAVAYAEKTGSGGNRGGSRSGTVVVSAPTGDAGLALYAALSVSSVLGMGWVGKKKHRK